MDVRESSHAGIKGEGCSRGDRDQIESPFSLHRLSLARWWPSLAINLPTPPPPPPSTSRVSLRYAFHRQAFGTLWGPMVPSLSSPLACDPQKALLLLIPEFGWPVQKTETTSSHSNQVHCGGRCLQCRSGAGIEVLERRGGSRSVGIEDRPPWGFRHRENKLRGQEQIPQIFLMTPFSSSTNRCRLIFDRPSAWERRRNTDEWKWKG